VGVWHLGGLREWLSAVGAGGGTFGGAEGSAAFGAGEADERDE
jgi:hypothetical protein